MYNELGLQKIKLFFLFFIFPFVVKAQTDFRNDNYIGTKNLWGDSSKFERVKLYKNDSVQVRWVPFLNKLQYVQAHPYNWNDGAMVPALIEALVKDPIAGVRSNSAWTIGQLCKELPSNVVYATAIDALIQAFAEDKDLGVRADTKASLLGVGDPRGLQLIETLEQDGWF